MYNGPSKELPDAISRCRDLEALIGSRQPAGAARCGHTVCQLTYIPASRALSICVKALLEPALQALAKCETVSASPLPQPAAIGRLFKQNPGKSKS